LAQATLLDENPGLPLGKGTAASSGWIRILLGMEVGLDPGDIVLDGDPAPPKQKGAQQPPTFWQMSIVAKQSPISATTELL